MRRFRLSRFLCAALLATPLLASADPRYIVTSFAGQESTATGINKLGQVVGALSSSAGGHAFVWGPGGLTDLGTFGGTYSQANAINDLGQVVGYYGDGSGGAGFLVGGGSASILPGGAYGINNSGTVAGAYWTTSPDGDGVTHAYTWAGGTMSDLGTLPVGDTSRAFAINGQGDVVGAAGTYPGPSANRPETSFLVHDGVMTAIGDLGGIWSAATSINDLGQIVGFSGTPADGGNLYPRFAFLADGGGLRSLGGLAPHQDSWAADINNLGQVVGGASMDGATSHAFLYENGEMIDLNALIDPASGWTIKDAAAINDVQQIAATACRAGVCEAVRLDLVSAVPEPPVFLMLLVGLVLGWRRLRGPWEFTPLARRRPG